ncbi:MAG: hypothetical protein ACOCY8_07170 [Spirochaetota bacterium]
MKRAPESLLRELRVHRRQRDLPRDDSTYEDAIDAVNQPRLRPFAEAGILLRLGD